MRPLPSLCGDELSEKSWIGLYRVIWLLRCGALIMCVKNFGFQHMVFENCFERNVCGAQL